MAGQFDPQIFQAAILEVAEATKAVVKLAQSVQQPPAASSSPAGSPVAVLQQTWIGQSF